MRRYASILLAVAMVVIFSGRAMAQEENFFTIKGYENSQIGIKGVVEARLNFIIEQIKSQLNDFPADGYQLQLKVIGSADAAGGKAYNEQLARQRAEQVAAILSYEFTNTKPSISSKGDVDNAKQVTVEWKFTPVIKPGSLAAEKKIINQVDSGQERVRKWGIIGIVAAVMIILGVVFSRRKSANEINIPRPSTRSGENTETASNLKNDIGDKEWWESIVTKGGKKYKVRLELRDGKYSTWFKTANGNRLCRKSKSVLLHDLKQGLENRIFFEQISGLQNIGIIRENFK